MARTKCAHPTRTPLNRRSSSRRWRQDSCEQRQSRGHFGAELSRVKIAAIVA
jgi:hypothetical protein